MVHRHSGKIINISSVWGCCGASCEVAYSATKGGINAFTQALAKELAPSNIQVNAIACGAIDTEMNAFLSEEDRQALTDEIPSGRFGRPEEVAELVLDLDVCIQIKKRFPKQFGNLNLYSIMDLHNTEDSHTLRLLSHQNEDVHR